MFLLFEEVIPFLAFFLITVSSLPQLQEVDNDMRLTLRDSMTTILTINRSQRGTHTPMHSQAITRAHNDQSEVSYLNPSGRGSDDLP